MTRACMTSAVLIIAASGAPGAQHLADLIATAIPKGEVAVFENEYVRIRYAVLEYPPAERREADRRPVVVYIRVAPGSTPVNTRPLDAPRGARPPWRPGVVPRGINIEVLKAPPPPPRLGEPGTSPPRDAYEEPWTGGHLVVATFRPSDFGVGTGGFASVTTFLSDGMIEVQTNGLRRRMWVEAGDAFWFDARTRITVIDDYPVGAAILQLSGR